MDELTELSATKLAALIRARNLSPVEVVNAYLHRVEQFNAKLNAVVTVAPDALDRAREAEAAVMRGGQLGPLLGVPVTIKDTIDTRGLWTSYGSRLYANHVPETDAHAVALLKQAGTIIFGKTNTSEFAMALDTDNPVFGRTNNPHEPNHTPGGSSGGEAAAISACLSAAGIGSDLSGSIRVPAHCCGVVGLKPTAGRVLNGGHQPPVVGALAIGASIGPLARRVEDLALLYDVLTANDAHMRPLHQSSSGPESYVQSLRGLRVAWYTDDGVVPVTTETERAVEAAVCALEDAGLVPTPARPPGVERGPALWFALFARAAAEFLDVTYDGREREAGAVVGQMLTSHKSSVQSSTNESLRRTSTPTPTAEYTSALDERAELRARLIEWMNATPLIVAPVGATSATRHDARRIEIKGQTFGTFRAYSYAQTFNVFGFPSVCIPAGQSSDGLPIGVQIVARPDAEYVALAAARVIEEALGGWQRPRRFCSQPIDNPL
ncbi:MAG: amidase [Acidobacteriota bacterium]|nr:amidase [Acidobacteriota bacterium]